MNLHEAFDTSPAAATAPATFHDLMAGIGYLLLQWSLLDRSLDEEIAMLRRASGNLLASSRARTVNERLAEWRALIARGRQRGANQPAIDRIGSQFQDFQRLRTLIGTGFVVASSVPEATYIDCTVGARQGMDGAVRMTLPDIVAAIDAMELCRSELALLRDFAAR